MADLAALKGAKVAVTGGSGDLGWHTIEVLLKHGAHVVSLDRSAPEGLRAAEHPRLRRVEVDITDADEVARVLAGWGCDGVIHSAAIVMDDGASGGFSQRFAKKRALAERVNVGGTKHVLDAAQRSDSVSGVLLVLPSLVLTPFAIFSTEFVPCDAVQRRR